MAGFDLGARDRLQPGAHDLRRVGAEVDRERDEAAVIASRRTPMLGSPKNTMNSCTIRGVLRMIST